MDHHSATTQGVQSRTFCHLCGRKFTDRNTLNFHLQVFDHSSSTTPPRQQKRGDNKLSVRACRSLTPSPLATLNLRRAGPSPAAAVRGIVPLDTSLSEISAKVQQRSSKKTFSPSQILAKKALQKRASVNATNSPKVKNVSTPNSGKKTTYKKTAPTLIKVHLETLPKQDEKLSNGLFTPEKTATPQKRKYNKESASPMPLKKLKKSTVENGTFPILQTEKPINTTCKVCKRTFKNVGLFKRHMNHHKLGKKPIVSKFKCNLCKFHNVDKNFWHTHFTTKHIEPLNKFYWCSDCLTPQEFDGGLETHKKESGHMKDVAFPCPLCDEVFQHLRDRYLHVFGSHYASDFMASKKFLEVTACPRCSLVFDSMEEANLHLQRDHLVTSIPIVSKRGNKYTMKYSCLHCPMKCVNPFILQSHLKKTHGMATPPRAKVHQAKVTCTLCSNKSFSTWQDWGNHFRCCHLDPKGTGPVHCNVCTKEFRTALQLNYHRSMQGHWPGDTPPTCLLCLDAFANLKQRLEHMLTSHLDTQGKETKSALESLVCHTCNDLFHSPSDRESHMEKHNPAASTPEHNNAPQSTANFSSPLIEASSTLRARKSLLTPNSTASGGSGSSTYYYCKTCKVANLRKAVGLRHHLYSKAHILNFGSLPKNLEFSRECPHCFCPFNTLSEYIMHRLKVLLQDTSTECDLCQEKWKTKKEAKAHLVSHLDIEASDTFQPQLVKEEILDEPSNQPLENGCPSNSGPSSVTSNESNVFITRHYPESPEDSPQAEEELSLQFSELLSLLLDDAALGLHFRLGHRPVDLVLVDILETIKEQPLPSFRANILKLLGLVIKDEVLDRLERETSSVDELIPKLTTLYKESLTSSLMA